MNGHLHMAVAQLHCCA